MALPRHPATMESLPGDILSDIFVRLFAKQLAQMRSVSKSWNALLSQSSFVKSHLHRSIHNNDDILLFLGMMFPTDYNSITTRPTHSPDLKLTNSIKTAVNPRSKNGYGSVTGSMNGLICFIYSSSFFPTHDCSVYIWNPSLSAVSTLPPCSLPYAVGNRLRFGYDSKTDDYKVVKLTCLYGQYCVLPEVEVYSMRKGSWELITQRFPSHITTIRDYDNVCADGHDDHLHWLACTDSQWKEETIVAFDLGAETFCEIPLPDSILHDHGSRYHDLGVLGGKLCVMSRVVPDGECEVWVMDEYGVPESWVKNHAFSQFSCEIIPYGFMLHNEFIFRDYDHFDLYDPVAANTKSFKITGVNQIVEYVDSLVWVAPTKHELSKRDLSKSKFKNHRQLKGLPKAIKGISRFLLSAVKRTTKGNTSAPILLYFVITALHDVMFLD